MTRLSAREKLTISAALQWLMECVNSSEPYDMSHLTFGDDPLSDDEIKSLCKCLRESPVDDYQSTLTTEELESLAKCSTTRTTSTRATSDTAPAEGLRRGMARGFQS